MGIRALFTIALLLSSLFLPFYFSAILAIGGMFYFKLYFEAILVLLFSDFIYGVPEAKFFNIVFVSGVSASLCLVGIELMKKKLKFYNKE